MSDVGGYELVLAFPDASPSFAHGMEAGRLWERLRQERRVHEEMIHTANREVVGRLAAAYGYVVDFADLAQGSWSSARFVPVDAA